MLITARSKGLLGARPDAATSAHGGAQDLGLFAAPPIAFGASLSPTTATTAVIRPGDTAEDAPEAQAVLGQPHFATPFAPSGPLSGDQMLPSFETAVGSVARSSVPQGQNQEQLTQAPASAPVAEAGTGSGGGIVPHAGLPATENAASSFTASPAAAAALPEVAPLVSAVETSAANLQAAVTALLGQIGSKDGAETLSQTVAEKGAALGQGVAALTDGIAGLPKDLGETSGDIVAGVSETTTQIVEDIGQLPPALTGALDAVPPLVEDALPAVGATVDSALDQTSSIVDDVVSDTADSLGSTIDRVEDVISATTDIVGDVGDVGDVAENVSTTTELIDKTFEPVTQIAQETVLPIATTVVGEVVEQSSDIGNMAANEVADTAGALLEAAEDAAAPVLESAADKVAPVVEHTSDTLGDLAGADPIGGVNTLTSLVSAADVFETHDEAPETTGLFALQDATDTLDGLIAGDADNDDGGGLLVDAQQNHGLLDGLTDHDGHGGLGLGLG